MLHSNKYLQFFLVFILLIGGNLFAEDAEETTSNEPVENELESGCFCDRRTGVYSASPFFQQFCCVSDTKTARACGACGVWLPEDCVLFKPFVADPRQVIYSCGWRFDDQALREKHVIDVSYGDLFALYRWFNVWPWGGDMQIEVEGAAWAVFAPLAEDTPLLNTDYYVGFPLTYRIPHWQFRLRGYHISSHVGDEYLLNHPEFDRRNPSAEYIDFFISHDFTDEIRLYAGLGWVVRDDETFRCRKFFAQMGAELRLYRLGFVDYCNQVYGTPYFAMDFQDKGNCRCKVDATYALGYEWGKLCGLCRKLRLFLMYHDGCSPDGQFCRKHNNYLSIRVGYGY